MKARIVIDRELCKECHLCIQACKKSRIIATTELNSKGYHPVASKEDEGVHRLHAVRHQLPGSGHRGLS